MICWRKSPMTQASAPRIKTNGTRGCRFAYRTPLSRASLLLGIGLGRFGGRCCSRRCCSRRCAAYGRYRHPLAALGLEHGDGAVLDVALVIEPDGPGHALVVGGGHLLQDFG